MKQKKNNKKSKNTVNKKVNVASKANAKAKKKVSVIKSDTTEKDLKTKSETKSTKSSVSSLKVKIGSKIIEIPSDYDPRKETKGYMCEHQRAYFKIKLQNWLDDIKNKLVAENVDDVNSDYRSTDESDQIAMEGHILTELRNKDRLRKLAKKIEEFIGKIDADTYGYCEETGNEIGINRLMVRPIARFCIEIQEKKDREEEEREFLEQNIEEEKNKVNNNDSEDED